MNGKKKKKSCIGYTLYNNYWFAIDLDISRFKKTFSLMTCDMSETSNVRKKCMIALSQRKITLYLKINIVVYKYKKNYHVQSSKEIEIVWSFLIWGTQIWREKWVLTFKYLMLVQFLIFSWPQFKKLYSFSESRYISVSKGIPRI